MSTPKEHGLMLSDPMVVARHEGRKTQTRRLIGPANTYVDGRRMAPKRWNELAYDLAHAWVDPGPSPAGNPGPYLKAERKDTMMSRLYPIYQPGDRIWWKECHYVERAGDAGTTGYIIYRATDSPAPVGRWSPSMLMPRWAARYVDTVVACRPERLGQVSDEDAKAEGVVWNMLYGFWHVPGLEVFDHDSPRGCYLKLMQHLHGEHIVAEDPWVWVITYRFGVEEEAAEAQGRREEQGELFGR